MNYKKTIRFLVLLYNREISSKIFQQKAETDPQIFYLISFERSFRGKKLAV